tara:strand:- start:1491 stop:1670 length:180 start_codon:yes stop_codon:yes gene_type:complete
LIVEIGTVNLVLMKINQTRHIAICVKKRGIKKQKKQKQKNKNRKTKTEKQKQKNIKNII